MKRDLFSRVRGNCTKKNPTECRLHGSKVRERITFERQVREHQEALAFKAKTDPDFAASWKVKTEPDGTTTVSVYRSGIVEAPLKRGVEAPSYLAADKRVPEGRQGRTTGIFASPTLGGVCRWVRGNYLTNILDVKVRELRVDVDAVYVYSIPAWEKASGQDKEEMYDEYWNSGITLREYMKEAKNNPLKYDPTEWELLLSAEGIRSVKPVGAVRASERAYNSYDVEEVRKFLQSK